MGLDDFSSDKKNNEASTNDDEEQTEEEQDDEVSGIEAFRTSETDPSKDDSGIYDGDDDYIFGLKPWRWNEMSKSKRVKHVRDNYIPDYHPDFQPDDRWKYVRTVEVECVCDNVFSFQSRGVCLDCGRTYKDAGRTVIKVNEIEEDNDNE